MSSIALTTMVIICGLVWGGFLLLLTLAFRQESKKSSGRKP